MKDWHRKELRELVGHHFMHSCGDELVLVHADPFIDDFKFIKAGQPLNERGYRTHGTNYNAYGVSRYMTYKGGPDENDNYSPA